jgi:hypothetical protein
LAAAALVEEDLRVDTLDKFCSIATDQILHNVCYQTEGFAIINKGLSGDWRAQAAICGKTSPFWPRPDHAIRTPETQGCQRSVDRCGERKPSSNNHAGSPVLASCATLSYISG